MVVGLFLITGCTKKGEEEKLPDLLEANQAIGWLKFYVPEDFTYQPDLRGLIYTEDERKIYTKGDYTDRSVTVIIDVIKQETDDYFNVYVDKLNKNITDVKYEKIKTDPTIYAREKYLGKSGDTTIYNYTYLMIYNSYVYSVTVSGPESKESELDTLRKNILDTLIIGQNS